VWAARTDTHVGAVLWPDINVIADPTIERLPSGRESAHFLGKFAPRPTDRRIRAVASILIVETSAVNSATSIAGVRRARLSYLAAVLLILLTASPFTAPFSVCNEAELSGESAGLDKKPCSKIADDSIDASATAIVLFQPMALVTVVDVPALASPIDRSPLLTVLRL
jgi:hypothetical protein